MAASDQAQTLVKTIQLPGDELPDLVKKAWDEVKSTVSSIAAPQDGTIALFEPSTTCKVVIAWIYAEVSRTSPRKLRVYITSFIGQVW